MDVRVPARSLEKAAFQHSRDDSYYKRNLRGAGAMAEKLASLHLSSPVRKLPTAEIIREHTTRYTIRKVSSKDHERALDFLKKSFFHDEPLNMAVNLLPYENSTCPELEDFALHTLQQGHSLMAVSEDGEVIGVCANAVTDITRDTREESFAEADACPNPKFRKILRLLSTVDCNVNFRERYPEATQMADIKIISVDGDYRGQGIAKKFLDSTIDLVRAMHIPFLAMECTSAFSAKAAARMGFTIVYRLKYADYCDGGSQPVFKPASPHSEVAVGILDL